MTEMLRGAIFLDRDGVINYNRTHHVTSWSEFEFLPGTFWALRKLAELAWPIVVISNQAAIGRGLVRRETVEDIHHRMVGMVEKTGGRIDAVYYCPHRPDESCACRKPNPGMLLRAAYDLHLDLARSFLVGDALTDIAAAREVGTQPILVATGRGQEQLNLHGARSFDGAYMADDLYGAANWMINEIVGMPPVRADSKWRERDTNRRLLAVSE
jgi:D-glycero-D-manno-heptose 1,7-bisphosphate phosphatase